MTPLYQRFLEHVPAGGAILDAGSGSGRDSLWFKHQGFQVEAFDASPAMVAATRSFAGVPTRLMRFEEFAWEHAVDGIWACASLLHVLRQDLPAVLLRLLAALNVTGCLYCSCKWGREERQVNGRYFNDMDEAILANLLSNFPARAKEVWRTSDMRPGRQGETWLNAILAPEPPAE